MLKIILPCVETPSAIHPSPWYVSVNRTPALSSIISPSRLEARQSTWGDDKVALLERMRKKKVLILVKNDYATRI